MKNKEFTYHSQLVCFCFEKAGEGDGLWERAVWFSGDSASHLSEITGSIASWPVCLGCLCHRALITSVFSEGWGRRCWIKRASFVISVLKPEFRKER